MRRKHNIAIDFQIFGVKGLLFKAYIGVPLECQFRDALISVDKQPPYHARRSPRVDLPPYL